MTHMERQMKALVVVEAYMTKEHNRIVRSVTSVMARIEKSMAFATVLAVCVFKFQYSMQYIFGTHLNRKLPSPTIDFTSYAW
jgi:hypothetical protein